MLNRDNGATIRVVPAIDLLDGHVVRLRQGRYDQVTEYPVDPDRAAATYAEQGATLLHVIDLSAARDGVRPPAPAEAIPRLGRTAGRPPPPRRGDPATGRQLRHGRAGGWRHPRRTRASGGARAGGGAGAGGHA